MQIEFNVQDCFYIIQGQMYVIYGWVFIDVKCIGVGELDKEQIVLNQVVLKICKW